MPAYHDIDDEPCHASRFLLTEVLRERWGFDGLVVADYIGISLLYQHHDLAADQAEAAALAFNAGLDVETPGDDCTPHLEEALDRGLIRMETIDADRPARPHREASARHLRAPLHRRGRGDPCRLPATVERRQRGGAPVDRGAREPRRPPPRSRRKATGRGDRSDRRRSPGHAVWVQLPGAPHPQQGRRERGEPGHARAPAWSGRWASDRVAYARGCHILEKRETGAPVFPGDVDQGSTLERTSPVSQRRDLIPEAVAVRSRRRPGRGLRRAIWPACSRPERWARVPTPTAWTSPACSRSSSRRWWPPASRWWWC